MANKARDSFVWVSHWGTVFNITSIWYLQNKPKMVIYVQAEMFSNRFKLCALKIHWRKKAEGPSRQNVLSTDYVDVQDSYTVPLYCTPKFSFRSTGATSGSNIPQVSSHTPPLHIGARDFRARLKTAKERSVFVEITGFLLCLCVWLLLTEPSLLLC